MRRFLGLVVAAVAATMLLALSADQAVGATVHCGDVITQDTVLDSDLINCPGDGLIVPAETTVTIDLNGHVIDGTRPSQSLEWPTNGITGSHATHVTVRNGVIQEFGHAINTAKGFTVADNMVFRLNYTSFEANHSEGTITNSLMTENYIGVMSEFQSSGVDVFDSEIVRNQTTGAILSASSLTNVVVSQNGGTGVDFVFPRSTVRDSTINDNGAYGASIEYGGSILDSVVTRNALDGVHVDVTDAWEGCGCFSSTTLVGNTVDRNGHDGIDVDFFGRAAQISGNHTWWNGDLGIEASPGVLGGGNWAKHNGNPVQCVPGSLCSTTGKPKG
jgi:hypothetical protein